MLRIAQKVGRKIIGQKVIDILIDERGSLDIFTTKVGLAVVSVIAIVLLIAAVNVTLPEIWDWFINGMKDAFQF